MSERDDYRKIWGSHPPTKLLACNCCGAPYAAVKEGNHYTFCPLQGTTEINLEQDQPNE